MVDNLIIIKRHDWIVKNLNGQYKNHGHFRTKQGAKQCLYLIKNKLVPRNKYYRGSALRISLDEEYKARVRHKIEKDTQKPHYMNVNKGK